MKMKRALVILTVTVAAIAFLAGGVRVARAQANASSNAPSSTKKVEKFPAIAKAITALEEARLEVQDPKNNFGGERQTAIASCNRTALQLRLLLAYEKEHAQGQ